jgi:hypothetical protein
VRGGPGQTDDSAGLAGAASYDGPVTRFVQQPGYEGAEFTGLSMAGATFREVDLSGARMRGVLLLGADIDGAIDGLRVNGVEVMPLQLGQALGLRRSRQLGGVGGGQVAQPGADHVQRLAGTGKGRGCTHLVTSSPGLVAAGGGSRPWRAGF